MSEIPVHFRPRRLSDWINPTGAKKVHSLMDKVYKRKNLEMAWEKVQANRGSGGVDGKNLEEFAAELEQQLDSCTENSRKTPIIHDRCGKCRSRKWVSRASIACWESQRFMTGYANRHCSTELSQYSNRYSMKPTSDIGEGDRRRTQCAKCGKRSRAGRSGSWKGT